MEDAFYSLNLEPIRRSDGRDSVAAVAYILGVRLRNDARPHGYSNFTQQRDRVIATGRALPHAVPDWAHDIAEVWNRNEKANNRSNSQLGQRVIVALPRELELSSQVNAVAQFATYLVQSYGVLVEYALHTDEGSNNPHAHLIFTDREMTTEGFGAKVRAFARKKFYYEIRDKWAEIGNAALASSGVNKRLSSKSYKARGIDKTPTQHQGFTPLQPSPQLIEAPTEREQTMTRKPDKLERFKYPNIAHLDFPPRIEEAETALQREEVERFYADNGQPVPVAAAAREGGDIWDGSLPSMAEAPQEVQAEYQQHLDEQSPPRPDRAHMEVMRSRQAEREYEALRARARDLHVFLTPQEKRIMDQVKNAPRDVQDYYRERIVLARMKELQARDFEQRRRELDKVILRTNRTHEQRERAEAFEDANRALKDLPRSYEESRVIDTARDEARELDIEQERWDMEYDPEYELERENEEPERER